MRNVEPKRSTFAVGRVLVKFQICLPVSSHIDTV